MVTSWCITSRSQNKLVSKDIQSLLCASLHPKKRNFKTRERGSVCLSVCQEFQSNQGSPHETEFKAR